MAIAVLLDHFFSFKLLAMVYLAKMDFLHFYLVRVDHGEFFALLRMGRAPSVQTPFFRRSDFSRYIINTDFYIFWRDSGGRVVVLRCRLLVAGGAELQDGGGIARA